MSAYRSTSSAPVGLCGDARCPLLALPFWQTKQLAVALLRDALLENMGHGLRELAALALFQHLCQDGSPDEDFLSSVVLALLCAELRLERFLLVGDLLLLLRRKLIA
jgi:hypothetical protein